MRAGSKAALSIPVDAGHNLAVLLQDAVLLDIAMLARMVHQDLAAVRAES